jgi:hypothetical protein
MPFQLTPEQWNERVTTGPSGRRMYVDDHERQRLKQVEENRKRWSKTFNTFRAIGLGIPAAAVAAPALAGAFGGGAAAGGGAAGGVSSAAPAASAGWGMSGVTAPTFGAAAAPVASAAGGVSMPAAAAGWASKVPWMSVGSKGVDTLFGIYANRQQSKANKEALAYQERANAEAMAYEREQMAEQRRQFDTQQKAAAEQWAAMQKFEADRWGASEEERLYDRRLKDERESRLAPRRAMAADALQRLPGLLASGRTSPGLGSLGSYRR